MGSEYVDVSIMSAGGQATVALRGEMDAHTATALDRTLEQAS
jgi:hypothetical protein